MQGRGDGRGGQLEECEKGFGLGKGNGGGLKEVEGEIKRDGLFGGSGIRGNGESLQREIEEKKREKNVSEGER